MPPQRSRGPTGPGIFETDVELPTDARQAVQEATIDLARLHDRRGLHLVTLDTPEGTWRLVILRERPTGCDDCDSSAERAFLDPLDAPLSS